MRTRIAMDLYNTDTNQKRCGKCVWNTIVDPNKIGYGPWIFILSGHCFHHSSSYIEMHYKLNWNNAGEVMHESYTKVSVGLGGAVLVDTVWSRYQGVLVISHTTVKQFKFSDGSLLHSHFMWSLSINSCIQLMRSIFNLKWFY